MGVVKQRFDNLEAVNQSIIQECRKGKAYSWSRKYLLRNENNGKIALVSLNLLQRFSWALHNLFCMHYFKSVFHSKDVIKILSAADFSKTAGKVETHASTITPPNRSKETAPLLSKPDFNNIESTIDPVASIEKIDLNAEVAAKVTSREYILDGATGTLTPAEVQEMAKTYTKGNFNKFLLSDPDPNSIAQNKVLLTNTLCKVNQTPADLKFGNVKASVADRDKLRALPLTAEAIAKKPEIRLEAGWFDYKEAHHFYIDFAHATSVGGAYKSFGCVQEERMFTEFLELAMIDFLTQNGMHPCIDPDGKSHQTFPPLASPYPFIVENVKRTFDISKLPYGGAFQNVKPKVLEKMIEDVVVQVEDAQPVNILGLAAMDYRKRKKVYSLPDLYYNFDAALLGNLGALKIAKEQLGEEAVATVHTAPWGCGAFLNSVFMIVALQYLAARVSGVNLVFHGVGNPLNPGYTQENIDIINAEIDQWLAEGKTAQQIIEILFERSKVDAAWRPTKEK